MLLEFSVNNRKSKEFSQKGCWGIFWDVFAMGGSGFIVFGLVTDLDGTSFDCMCLDSGRVVTFVLA